MQYYHSNQIESYNICGDSAFLFAWEPITTISIYYHYIDVVHCHGNEVQVYRFVHHYHGNKSESHNILL